MNNKKIPDQCTLICLIDSIMSLAIGDVAMNEKMDGHEVGNLIYSRTGFNAEELHALAMELEKAK